MVRCGVRRGRTCGECGEYLSRWRVIWYANRVVEGDSTDGKAGARMTERKTEEKGVKRWPLKNEDWWKRGGLGLPRRARTRRASASSNVGRGRRVEHARAHGRPFSFQCSSRPKPRAWATDPTLPPTARTARVPRRRVRVSPYRRRRREAGRAGLSSSRLGEIRDTRSVPSFRRKAPDRTRRWRPTSR